MVRSDVVRRGGWVGTTAQDAIPELDAGGRCRDPVPDRAGRQAELWTAGDLAPLWRLHGLTCANARRRGRGLPHGRRRLRTPMRPVSRGRAWRVLPPVPSAWPPRPAPASALPPAWRPSLPAPRQVSRSGCRRLGRFRRSGCRRLGDRRRRVTAGAAAAGAVAAANAIPLAARNGMLDVRAGTRCSTPGRSDANSSRTSPGVDTSSDGHQGASSAPSPRHA